MLDSNHLGIMTMFLANQTLPACIDPSMIVICLNPSLFFQIQKHLLHLYAVSLICTVFFNLTTVALFHVARLE